LTAEVTVTNTGKRAGDEVAQLYLGIPNVAGEPIRALRGFRRVHLGPGQSETLRFELKPRDLIMVSEAGEPIIPEGTYSVSVGGGQPNTVVPTAAGSFEVKGSSVLPVNVHNNRWIPLCRPRNFAPSFAVVSSS
jgi:beta-glucosidase